MLNRFKIGVKLTMAFGIVALLLLSLAAVSIYSFNNVDKTTGQLLDLFDSANRAGQCVDHAQQMRRHFLLYLNDPSPELNAMFNSELESTAGIIRNVRENSPIQDNRDDATGLIRTLDTLADQKKRYIEQENTVAEIRTACGAVSGRVRSGLSSLADDLMQRFKTNAKNDTDGQRAIKVNDYDLDRSIQRALALVEEVLHARDSFVFAMAADQRILHEATARRALEALGLQLNEIRRNESLPAGDFANRVVRIQEELAEWARTADRYIGAIKTERDMVEPLLENIRNIMSVVMTIQGRVVESAQEAGKEQHALIVFVRTVSIALSATALAIAILLAVVLTVSITSGLRTAVGAMERVANEGDVTVELQETDLRRGDEIGDIANAVKNIVLQFRNVEKLASDLAEGNYDVETKVRGDLDSMNNYLNKMLDEVNKAMLEIGESVKQVTTGANEVSSASQSLSSGAQESAASLQQITASMSQISSQVKQNAESATQARDLAQNSSKSAAEGQEAMRDMTSAMGRITDNSREIQRVIKVIDDIAFQTNLLALNAAVEAARAGQHGKGFAVVAEEVRNLASRSAKAARETSELIAKSGHEIEAGGEVATRTADMLNTLVEGIKQTTDLVAGIAIASNEQAQGVNQITIGLQQIDQVTQQNTAASEECASAANEMSAMAGHLQQLVAKFKLRGQGRKGLGSSSASTHAPSAEPKHTPYPKPAAPAHTAHKPAPAHTAHKPAPAPARAIPAAPVKHISGSDPSAPIDGNQWGGGGSAEIQIDLDAKDFGKY